MVLGLCGWPAPTPQSPPQVDKAFDVGTDRRTISNKQRRVMKRKLQTSVGRLAYMWLVPSGPGHISHVRCFRLALAYMLDLLGVRSVNAVRAICPNIVVSIEDEVGLVAPLGLLCSFGLRVFRLAGCGNGRCSCLRDVLAQYDVHMGFISGTWPP